MAKGEYRDKVIIKRRMLISFSILCVLFFALCCRLVFVMVINSNKLKSLAKDQWTSEVKIDARRGSILDRNGHELAVSADVYRVDLDMNTIRQYVKKNNLTYEIIAPKLAQALNIEQDKVLKELYKTLPSGLDRQSANLARRIEKTEADKVTALKISGVMVSPDTKRYYPQNNFLAQVLGCTNVDGKGLSGIELQYDKVLSGTPGLRMVETGRRSEELPNIISTFTPPVNGKNVVLTIDNNIQAFCQEAAQQALNDNKAKAVTIMVMDPKTGEVLGMANYPDFNPNNPREGADNNNDIQKMWRNRAVNDTYEPGSIFKVFTAIAAMEEGVVKESDQFVCNGSLQVANRNIHCWKRTGHGVENFVDILKNSCNVGFMNLGERLGASKLNTYIKKFGFGQKTGIDLNGEAKGIVKSTDKITTVDLATISFGQSNTVTPIQYMAAFNAIANNGEWVTPHVMKDITEVKNNSTIVDSTFISDKNYVKKQLVSKENANLLCQYLEKVVSEGGGHKAFIDGYHIAGKTGTAQKVSSATGSYEPGKYVASFAGMAPAENPKFTVFVSIDEPDPSNYYAGQIAAPVGQQVFNDIFNYYSMKASASAESVAESLKKDVIIPEVRGMKTDEAVKLLKANNLQVEVNGTDAVVNDMSPKAGYTVKEGFNKVILYTGSDSNYNKEVVVPDLTGFSKQKAIELLNSLGLKSEFDGEGLVADQDIDAGQIVTKGTVIKLELDVVAGD